MKTLQQLIDEEVAAVLAADNVTDLAALAAKDAAYAALLAEYNAYKASHPDAPADTTAPSVPTGLVATPVSTSQINLTWNASTDNVGVTSYLVFRNGVQVATGSSTNYSNTGLTASTTYTFTVKAKDAAGNISASSAVVSATTQAVPSGFVWPNATNTGAQGTLTTYTGPMIITANNTVITGKQINGGLEIKASGFTMRNCKINYSDSWGVNGDGATGPMTIEDCTFIGAGAGGFSVAPILGSGTFRRLNISGSSMGMNLQNVCTVEFCWIHNLARQPGDHYDGIAMMGSNRDSLIKDNLIETPSGSVTAHVFISGQFAPCSNNRVEHNRCTGSASYPLYSESHNHPVSGSVFVDNEMVKGDYGNGSFFSSYCLAVGNTPVHSGNKTLTGVALD